MDKKKKECDCIKQDERHMCPQSWKAHCPIHCRVCFPERAALDESTKENK